MSRGAKRVRADQLLVERGLAPSRSRAAALIMAGAIFAGEQRIDKAGQLVDPDGPLELRGADHPWVSRGGLKLERALETFAIDPAGAICLDIGASTGGFTDVLLARGAARIYAVDVGHGQLAWKLRQDARVVVLERINARHLTTAQISEPIGIIVCDASFIGLETVLPTPMSFAAPGCRLIALIKPQFEVGPDQVGKGGIVRDPALHEAVCERIRAWIAGQPGWQATGIVDSPITGADGNREFLLAASKG
ncbi:MAG: TlyA family RNA methyltransferase [Dongiaceae bacterium]